MELTDPDHVALHSIFKVSDQKQKVGKAVKLRDRFYGNKADLENKLKQCEEQLQAVDVVGVSVPTKLDRYKVRADWSVERREFIGKIKVT